MTLEEMRKIFPQCEVTDEEINWIGHFDKGKGGAYREGCKDTRKELPYVEGYRDEVTIDGPVDAIELAALLDWMQKK